MSRHIDTEIKGRIVATYYCSILDQVNPPTPERSAEVPDLTKSAKPAADSKNKAGSRSFTGKLSSSNRRKKLNNEKQNNNNKKQNKTTTRIETTPIHHQRSFGSNNKP